MELSLFEIAWATLLHWMEIPPERAQQPEVRQMWMETVANYRQPERAYHNLDHALRVLRDAKRFCHRYGVDDYGAVQLAALLHDVVYDPRRTDNEARSAEFVESWGLALDFPRDTCRRAADIILATRDHRPTGSPDAALVLDADLAVLASPWREYDAYRRAIRREYRWVEEADWAAGRGRVLTGLLAQDLYQLPALRDRWEEPARWNIERELSLL